MHLQSAVIWGNTRLEDITPIDELEGQLSPDPEEKRLMRSVMENDHDTIQDGKLLTSALNTGISSFTPDLLFEKLVTNYKLAKTMYGPSFLREVTGYSEGQIERNKHIREFIQDLKKRIGERITKLRREGYIDGEGFLTDKAIKLSKVMLYTEELDKLASKGLLGEREHRKSFGYGTKDDVKPFQKDRYRDLALRKTIRRTIRRSHKKIEPEDLVAFERKSKGKRVIIYALDASGSMKGFKLEQSKKAGIALAHKAIEEKDSVGLIVFGKKVKTKVSPTTNFRQLLEAMTRIQAKEKTNIAVTVKEATDLFPREEATKHLILITDAMPTAGAMPEKDTLEAVAITAGKSITISIIGIQLNKEGEAIARKITEAGNGRLFTVRNVEELDIVVLEDYYKE